jgi:lipopolysaccharide transport protein LptA
MARSLLGNSCAGAVLLALALAGGAQEAGDEAEEIVFESGPLAFNGQTNLFEIEAPRIRQGDLRIAAGRAVASGIEFDESNEWRFSDKVRIEVGTAVIEADSAVFTFADEQLAHGVLDGSTSFSDVDPETQARITGRAQKMSYDYVARTLRMIGDVWMQKGKTQMQGCDIVYDFATERVTSDCAEGFRATVIPDSDERASAPAAPE